jgi:hypothetical protein
MPEPRIPTPPQGNLKIHAEHFRKVVRRIECIKPLAGNNVTLTPTEDGIKIDCTVTKGGDNNGYYGECGFVAQGYSSLFKVIYLNVCSNGQPAEIAVFAPKDGRAGDGGFLCEA